MVTKLAKQGYASIVHIKDAFAGYPKDELEEQLRGMPGGSHLEMLLVVPEGAERVKEALRDIQLTRRVWDLTIVRPADGFQRPPDLPWTAEWYDYGTARVPTEILVKLSLANGNEVVVRDGDLEVEAMTDQDGQLFGGGDMRAHFPQM